MSLFFIILFSYLCTFVARKIHTSDVIALLLAGFALNLPVLNFYIKGSEEAISILSISGLFALMFLAGFEVSWNIILREEKHALVVSFSTVLVSLFIGTGTMLLLDFPLSTALLVGICLGITAEATKARALIQLKKIKTKLGSLLMGTGISNDILGLALFIAVLYFFADNISWTEVFILLGVISSFALGSLVHYQFNRYSKRIRKLERLLLVTIVPFFFVDMGISFFEGVSDIDIKILLIILLIGLFSQVIGVYITKPIIKLRPHQMALLGWGMNAKGSVELAIAHVALVSGLFTHSLYSTIVITVLVSAVLFQLIIFSAVKKYPEIMD